VFDFGPLFEDGILTILPPYLVGSPYPALATCGILAQIYSSFCDERVSFPVWRDFGKDSKSLSAD
jgi:hypothetical protein